MEPNTAVLLKTVDNSEKLYGIADYIEDYQVINDRTTYYICENHRCLAPTNDLICK